MVEDPTSRTAARDDSVKATDGSTAISGNQNVVINGEVHGDVTVTIACQDMRPAELRYLDVLLPECRRRAGIYTPLAGTAEVWTNRQQDPAVDEDI